VRWLFAALLMMAAMPAAADSPDDIRAARARYNAAIATRDADTIRTMFVDDYKGLAGSGGELIAGGDAMAAYFARAFQTPGFRGFVRTPDVVTIATPPDRAMERGHWHGTGTTATGETRVEGEYLAVWVPTPAGWRLRSESFVTLTRLDNSKP
jgi:ketosteroid isomerase-like protein